MIMKTTFYNILTKLYNFTNTKFFKYSLTFLLGLLTGRIIENIC